MIEIKKGLWKFHEGNYYRNNGTEWKRYGIDDNCTINLFNLYKKGLNLLEDDINDLHPVFALLFLEIYGLRKMKIYDAKMNKIIWKIEDFRNWSIHVRTNNSGKVNVSQDILLKIKIIINYINDNPKILNP